MNTDCTDKKADKINPAAKAQYKHEEITKRIINAAHTVHNQLGYGFLEKVYHNALIIELKKTGLLVESQKPIGVKYDNQVVGEYFADVVVDRKVIIEVKAADRHNRLFEAQLLNYLKGSDLQVGLIINFGTSVEVKRMVF